MREAKTRGRKHSWNYEICCDNLEGAWDWLDTCQKTFNSLLPDFLKTKKNCYFLTKGWITINDQKIETFASWINSCWRKREWWIRISSRQEKRISEFWRKLKSALGFSFTCVEHSKLRKIDNRWISDKIKAETKKNLFLLVLSFPVQNFKKRSQKKLEKFSFLVFATVLKFIKEVS